MTHANDKLSRRQSLQILGLGGLAVTGLIPLAACGNSGSGASGGAAPADGPSCNSAIEPQSQQLRTTLQYRPQTADPAKKCSGCAQFKAAQYGDCGGCNLFTGPVQPNGNCLSWAAVAAPAAAP
jgi:hypothetical protein